MFNRFKLAQKEYPPQFWLLFWGMLISTAGASMIWPFLMVYVSERLKLPMTNVASLMTISAGTGLLSSFIAGSIIDRFGRKWSMVISLAFSSLAYLAMIFADSMFAFAILMALRGAFNPLYRVGSDAMVADLIPAGKRADAYSLTRLSKNVGVALGPAIGGFMASTSYSITFCIAAAGLFTYSLLIAFFATETLPKPSTKSPTPLRRPLGGYEKILKDKPFIYFVSAMTLTMIGSTMVWVLLAVYAKHNYQVPENLYGMIPMTNALMVVSLQIGVTKITKRHNPQWMMTVGAALYAIGVSSIALGDGFWDFWISMVILTLGELALVPTATTYAANRAPVEMRGRYMSIYSLSWGTATGIGPIIGGFLNDNLSPKSIWVGGGFIVLISTILFGIFAYRNTSRPQKFQPDIINIDSD